MTNLELQFQTRVPALLNNISERLDTRTLAAIMFGQAIVSREPYLDNYDDVAEKAVKYADALVDKLDKTA